MSGAENIESLVFQFVIGFTNTVHQHMFGAMCC